MLPAMDHVLTRQAALEAFDHGYEVVLYAENSKRPKLAGWAERVMSRAEIGHWIGRYRLNYGIRLGRTGVCVLDKDRRSAATTAFLKEHGARSPMEVLTPHAGVHGYYRIPSTLTEVRTRIKWLGLGLDVKLTGAVVGRGSVVDGVTYRLKSGRRMVPKDALPFLPATIVGLLDTPPITPATKPIRPVMRDTADVLARVRKYVSCITARCHHGAHNQAFRCACKIADAIADFGLAMDVYREWNAAHAVAADGVTPYPFSEKELEHKMTDAFRRSHPRGQS